MSGRRRDLLAAREVAPRLARAHDQVVAERAYRRFLRPWLTTEILETERLIAHRELQLIRAGRVGRRKYVDVRTTKLDEARSRLAGLRHWLAICEETPLWDLLPHRRPGQPG